MRYAVMDGKEYVTTGSTHWLNLLNDTSKNKQYAYTYATKADAIKAMNAFIADAGDMYNGCLSVKGIRS